MEWLKLFKKVISDSLKDGRIKLKVQGFASVAPVPVGGVINDRQSDSLNCEIANQRAEALVYFLTTEQYDLTECKTVLGEDDRWGHGRSNLRTPGRPNTLLWERSNFNVTYDDSLVQWKGPNLTVSHRPWEKYEKMENNKPMKNPNKDRQLDLEFLNRSVQIIIEEVMRRPAKPET